MLPSNATVEEKSLALAELMGWEVREFKNPNALEAWTFDDWRDIEPYSDSMLGQAQSNSIIIKFNEALRETRHVPMTRCTHIFLFEEIEPTQANILDEILRMNGRME